MLSNAIPILIMLFIILVGYTLVNRLNPPAHFKKDSELL
jgi:hypothetical protein